MTTALLDQVTEPDAYFEIDRPEKEDTAPTRSTRFAERWLRDDPLVDAVEQLELLGREDDANLVRAILSQREAHISDEDLIRNLVSLQWADDWDSEEDRLYNDL